MAGSPVLLLFATVLSAASNTSIHPATLGHPQAVPGCLVATPMGGAPILLMEPVEPIEAGECEWGACTADTDCGGQYYHCGDAGCCIVVPV